MPYQPQQARQPQALSPRPGQPSNTPSLEQVIAQIPEGDITQSQFQHITNLLKSRLRDQPPSEAVHTQQQPALQPAQPPQVVPTQASQLLQSQQQPQQSQSVTSPLRPVPVHGAGTTPVHIINTFLHKGRPTPSNTAPALPVQRPTQLSLLDQYQLQHQQSQQAPGFQPYLQPYTAVKRPRSPPRTTGAGYLNLSYDSRYNVNNNNSMYYPGSAASPAPQPLLSSSSVSPQQVLFEDEYQQSKRRYNR